MALSLTKPFTFSAITTAASAQVNSDFDSLYNAFSGLEAGTSSMSKLPLDADPTSALHAVTKQYVDNIINYRRPNLKFVSPTTVDIENNTKTANETKIVFPDGTTRSVTEDTSSTNKYRRFIITSTASLVATHDSGMRSTESEANNTWYALYAVKTTDDTSKFVIVGTVTLPIQANYATLDGYFGANGWVYLGLIKNGNNEGSFDDDDIISFSQNGNMTLLSSYSTTSNNGARLTYSASTISLAYDFSTRGTGAAQIPNNVGVFLLQSRIQTPLETDTWQITRTSAPYYGIYATSKGLSVNSNWIPADITGATDVLINTAGAAAIMDIRIVGYIDKSLSGGIYPQI